MRKRLFVLCALAVAAGMLIGKMTLSPVAAQQINSAAINVTSGPPDATATGSLTNTTTDVRLPMQGYQGAGFVLSGVWSGTVISEVSIDGGTTWNHTTIQQVAGQTGTAGTTVTSTSVNGQFLCLDLGGAALVRVRFFSYTSGTLTVNLRTTAAQPPATHYLATQGGSPATRIITTGLKDANGNMQYWAAGVPFKTRNLAGTVTAVKATAGILKTVTVVNNQAAVAFVQIFNVAAGSVTLGTTTPDWEIQVAANSSVTVNFAPDGLSCGTAISVASTTAEGGGTGSAAGVMVFVTYL